LRDDAVVLDVEIAKEAAHADGGHEKNNESGANYGIAGQAAPWLAALVSTLRDFDFNGHDLSYTLAEILLMVRRWDASKGLNRLQYLPAARLQQSPCQDAMTSIVPPQPLTRRDPQWMRVSRLSTAAAEEFGGETFRLRCVVQVANGKTSFWKSQRRVARRRRRDDACAGVGSVGKELARV
jgi:hypothetical protein